MFLKDEKTNDYHMIFRMQKTIYDVECNVLHNTQTMMRLLIKVMHPK